MEQTISKLGERDFEGLCNFVCRQLAPSHSREVDREALYFAICWKLCDLTGQRLSLPVEADSRIRRFREMMRNLVSPVNQDTFDAPTVADRVIRRFIGKDDEIFGGAFDFSRDTSVFVGFRAVLPTLN